MKIFLMLVWKIIFLTNPFYLIWTLGREIEDSKIEKHWNYFI